jgi:hypothetical protein
VRVAKEYSRAASRTGEPYIAMGLIRYKTGSDEGRAGRR